MGPAPLSPHQRAGALEQGRESGAVREWRDAHSQLSRAGDDGAVGNRDARYVFGVIGMWDAGEPRGGEFRDWVRDAWARLRPFSTGGNYINFQTADEGEERIRATYGANYDRLVSVKQRYDPTNLFRSNRNIRPG